MGTSTQVKKLNNYYKIFEQVYDDPLISIYDISVNTGLNRNTVSKYLKEMYAKGILHGPCIRMNPSHQYKEYVYLMNFSDPWMTFRGLKGFPHVVYHAVTVGDWNTIVITDRLLDFSTVVGFDNVIDQGMRYVSYTPKAAFTTWDKSFETLHERVDRFTPVRNESKNRWVTSLDWGTDQWILYTTFNSMRKKVTPLLQKMNMRFETYTAWLTSLQEHCTIHTGFYPEEYHNYLTYCFLFYTDYEASVKSVFSLFPATSFVMELDKQLLGVVCVTSAEVKRNLFCSIYDMKTKQMIKGFRQAVVLFHSVYTPQEGRM